MSMATLRQRVASKPADAQRPPDAAKKSGATSSAAINPKTTPAAIVFSLIVGLQFVWLACVLDSNSAHRTAGFFLALLAAMVVTKRLAISMIRAERIGNPIERAKFETQAWQLVLHGGFCLCESVILFAPGFEGCDGGWAYDTATLWQPRPSEQSMSAEVRTLYQAQLAGWLMTAVAQFFKPPDKDYLAMLVHHAATIALVGVSYTSHCTRIGLLVLFLHDASDVPCDLLKLANFLRLSGRRCGFCVELLFATVVVSWAALRLYALPRHLTASLVWEGRRALDGGAGAQAGGEWSLLRSLRAPLAPEHDPALRHWAAGVGFLSVLQALHLYWFLLFCRIGWRLLRGEAADKVAAAEYAATAPAGRRAAGGGGGRAAAGAVASLVARTARRALLAALCALAGGALLGPHALRAYGAARGAADDAAARAAATAGLSLAPGQIPEAAQRHTLGAAAGDAVRAALRYHGFVHFAGALAPAEVAAFEAERQRIEASLLADGAHAVYGVPLFRGGCAPPAPPDAACLHRIPFGSEQSAAIRALVHDARFEPVRALFADDAFCAAAPCDVRVGDREKDGVVMNAYVNLGAAAANATAASRPQQGWHTDAFRDLAMLKRPKPMLNFGIHLDSVDPAAGDAALCLIPGTHRQGLLGFLFRKPYFLGATPDAAELCVATTAGDVTVHDGRLWHRVAPSAHASLRRTVYVPYLTSDQPYLPKHADSPTPFYHHLGGALRPLLASLPIGLHI